MFCVNRYLFTMFVIKLFLSYQDEDREHDPVQRQEASLEEDQAEAVSNGVAHKLEENDDIIMSSWVCLLSNQ